MCSLCARARAFVCVSVCTRVCVRACVRLCVRACVSVCLCVCVCVGPLLCPPILNASTQASCVLASICLFIFELSFTPFKPRVVFVLLGEVVVLSRSLSVSDVARDVSIVSWDDMGGRDSVGGRLDMEADTL